jgi:SulP family sulfate permease
MLDLKNIRLLQNRSTRLDFLVILSVVLSALFFDLMTASVVGISLAIIMFIRDQMKVSVIRRTFSGEHTFSKHLRSISELAILEASGNKTLILELQGHLFFGTTDQLYSSLEPHLKTSRFVILDMRRIQSVDYTATQMLKQIHARLREEGGSLIVSNLLGEKNILEHLLRTRPAEFEGMLLFHDLNAALEHTEDVTLSEARFEKTEVHEGLELHDFEIFKDMPQDVLQAFSNCIETREFKAGEELFKEKDPGNEIYFIRSGTIQLNLHLAQQRQIRLLTISQGGMFGEMAFIDRQSRSSDAIAVRTASLFVLPRSGFDDIARKHPATAVWFFERMASIISARLRISNAEVKSLKEH